MAGKKKAEKKVDLMSAAMYLTDRGYVRIVAAYSGSGDSGQVDIIQYLKKGESNLGYDESEARTRDVDHEVHQFIEELIYKKLEDVEDWYNNDGGDGEFIIDLKKGTYEIENRINFTHQETYNHDGKLKDIDSD